MYLRARAEARQAQHSASARHEAQACRPTPARHAARCAARDWPPRRSVTTAARGAGPTAAPRAGTHSALAATSSGVAIATKWSTPSRRNVWYAQRRMERMHFAAPTARGAAVARVRRAARGGSCGAPRCTARPARCRGARTAVVGDQDLADGPVAAASRHPLRIVWRKRRSAAHDELRHRRNGRVSRESRAGRLRSRRRCVARRRRPRLAVRRLRFAGAASLSRESSSRLGAYRAPRSRACSRAAGRRPWCSDEPRAAEEGRCCAGAAALQTGLACRSPAWRRDHLRMTHGATSRRRRRADAATDTQPTSFRRNHTAAVKRRCDDACAQAYLAFRLATVSMYLFIAASLAMPARAMQRRERRSEGNNVTADPQRCTRPCCRSRRPTSPCPSCPGSPGALRCGAA